MSGKGRQRKTPTPCDRLVQIARGRFGVDADVGDTVVRFAGIRVEPHTFLDCLTAATFDHLNSRHPHSVAFGISSLAPDVWVAMTEEWPTDPVPLTCGSHRALTKAIVAVGRQSKICPQQGVAEVLPKGNGRPGFLIGTLESWLDAHNRSHTSAPLHQPEMAGSL